MTGWWKPKVLKRSQGGKTAKHWDFSSETVMFTRNNYVPTLTTLSVKYLKLSWPSLSWSRGTSRSTAAAVAQCPFAFIPANLGMLLSQDPSSQSWTQSWAGEPQAPQTHLSQTLLGSLSAAVWRALVPLEALRPLMLGQEKSQNKTDSDCQLRTRAYWRRNWNNSL